MNYLGLPSGIWLLFHRSFRKKLVSVLGFNPSAAAETEKKVRTEYRAIIARLPEFEKGDRFKMNILSCAMLSAFLLSMERRPTAEALTDYYAQAMMTPPTRWFCRENSRAIWEHFGYSLGTSRSSLCVLYSHSSLFSHCQGLQRLFPYAPVLRGRQRSSSIISRQSLMRR